MKFESKFSVSKRNAFHILYSTVQYYCGLSIGTSVAAIKRVDPTNQCFSIMTRDFDLCVLLTDAPSAMLHATTRTRSRCCPAEPLDRNVFHLPTRHALLVLITAPRLRLCSLREQRAKKALCSCVRLEDTREALAGREDPSRIPRRSPRPRVLRETPRSFPRLPAPGRVGSDEAGGPADARAARISSSSSDAPPPARSRIGRRSNWRTFFVHSATWMRLVSFLPF